MSVANDGVSHLQSAAPAGLADIPIDGRLWVHASLMRFIHEIIRFRRVAELLARLRRITERIPGALPPNSRRSSSPADDRMRSANENAEVNRAQRTYARLAGILMLGVIIIALGGGAILSNIAGNGTFARRRPGLQHRNVYIESRSRAW